MRKPSENSLTRGRYNLLNLLCVCILGSLASCNGGATPGDEVLVTFGEEELLREEVDLFTPDGLSSADSIKYADQYVNQWIQIQAMAAEARSEVSSKDASLRYKMARYRDQLVSQMFAEKLVAERPELQSVSAEEIEGYYQRHLENFQAVENFYQYFYLKTTLAGQYRIVNLLRSDEPEDLDEVKSWARENAVTWKLDSTWLPEAELLRYADGYYFGDITRAYVNTVYPYAHDEEGVKHYDFLRILAVVKSGEQLPLSLCENKIAQIILNERKNALVEETQAILVNQAKKSGAVTDYRN